MTNPPIVYVEEPDVVEAAIERLSDEMMSRPFVEEWEEGGLVASMTYVRVRYDDLRIVLAELDKARASTPPVTVDDVELVECVAKAICAADGQIWRKGKIQFQRPADDLNNHWRHKGRAALEAIRNRKGDDRG